MEKPSTNPWKGWSSYLESDSAVFTGRRQEIDDLYLLIRDHTLVTLYGRSGVGKTSLLQAGVFPVLRLDGFEPMVCRFDGSKPCVETVIETIGKHCTVVSSAKVQDTTSLVRFFSTSRFKKNGRDVIPVIVFDQFEDLLKGNPEYYTPLFEQLHVVASDFVIPGMERNFRFVISIREDFLYLLEDATDSFGYTYFKDNRYRLLPLSEQAADAIISIYPDMPDAIRSSLKQLTVDGKRFYPGLLSFYLHQLYEASGGDITEDSLRFLGDGTGLISRYYDSLFRGPHRVSKETRRYIETNLQKNGMRSSVTLCQAKENIPEINELLDNGDKKLLQKFPVGNDLHVELVHDKVAEIIRQNIARNDDRRWRIMIRTLIAALAVFLLWCGTALYNRALFNNFDSSMKTGVFIGNNFSSSPLIRKVLLTKQNTQKWVSLSNLPNLNTIEIENGCDSVSLIEIPSKTTIVIPASLRSIALPIDAGNLFFEVDTANTCMELSGRTLWDVRGDKPRIIWTDYDGNRYISLPESAKDKYGDYDYRGRTFHAPKPGTHWTSWNYDVNDSNGGYYSDVIIRSDASIVDLSDSPERFRGKSKRINSITGLEFVETLILPDSAIIPLGCIVGAPRLTTLILGNACDISGNAVVDCPALTNIVWPQSTDFSSRYSPFMMCPELEFELKPQPGPYSFEKGVLRSEQHPYLIHSDDGMTHPELFEEEIKNGYIKDNWSNGLIIRHDASDEGYRLLNNKYSNLLQQSDDKKVLYCYYHFIPRSDLAGLTDIYLLKCGRNDSYNLNLLPLEAKKKITLHLPYGSSPEFLSIKDANEFKEVVTDSYWHTLYVNAKCQLHFPFHGFLHSNGLEKILLISLVLLALCMIFRRFIRRNWQWILVAVLLGWGIFWSAIGVLPEMHSDSLREWNIIIIISAVISLFITLFAVKCNRHSFDGITALWRKGMRIARKAPAWFGRHSHKLKRRMAAFSSRHHKSTLFGLVAAAVLVIAILAFLILNAIAVSRISKINSLISKGQLVEACRLLPDSHWFYPPSQRKQLEKTVIMLMARIRPVLPAEVHNLEPGCISIESAAISRNGRRIAVMSHTRELTVYDFKTGQQLFSSDMPLDAEKLEFSATADSLVAYSSENIWFFDINARTGRRLPFFDKDIRSVRFSSKEHNLILETFGRAILSFNLDSDKSGILTNDKLGEPTPDGAHSIYVNNRHLELRDLHGIPHKNKSRRLDFPERGTYRDPIFSPSADTVYLWGRDTTVIVDLVSLSFKAITNAPDAGCIAYDNGFIYHTIYSYTNQYSDKVIRQSINDPAYCDTVLRGVKVVNTGSGMPVAFNGHAIYNVVTGDSMILENRILPHYDRNIIIRGENVFAAKSYYGPYHRHDRKDSLMVKEHFNNMFNPNYLKTIEGTVVDARTWESLPVDTTVSVTDISPDDRYAIQIKDDTAYIVERGTGADMASYPVGNNSLAYSRAAFLGDEHTIALQKPGGDSVVVMRDGRPVFTFRVNAFATDPQGQFIVNSAEHCVYSADGTVIARTVKPHYVCHNQTTPAGRIITLGNSAIVLQSFPRTIDDKIRMLKEYYRTR